VSRCGPAFLEFLREADKGSEDLGLRPAAAEHCAGLACPRGGREAPAER
jgi:hypothetical protein